MSWLISEICLWFSKIIPFSIEGILFESNFSKKICYFNLVEFVDNVYNSKRMINTGLTFFWVKKKPKTYNKTIWLNIKRTRMHLNIVLSERPLKYDSVNARSDLTINSCCTSSGDHTLFIFPIFLYKHWYFN